MVEGLRRDCAIRDTRGQEWTVTLSSGQSALALHVTDYKLAGIFILTHFLHRNQVSHTAADYFIATSGRIYLPIESPETKVIERGGGA